MLLDRALAVEVYDCVALAVELDVKLPVALIVPVEDNELVAELDRVEVILAVPVPVGEIVEEVLPDTVGVSVDVEEEVLDKVGKLVDD